MSAALLATVLHSISYKPNWTIDDGTSLLRGTIRFTMKVPDRDDPTRIINVDANVAIPEFILRNPEPQRIVHWVFDQIREIEIHEATEWFKVNGVRIKEPHS